MPGVNGLVSVKGYPFRFRSGFEATRQIREIEAFPLSSTTPPKHTPVIACTGTETAEDCLSVHLSFRPCSLSPSVSLHWSHPRAKWERTGQGDMRCLSVESRPFNPKASPEHLSLPFRPLPLEVRSRGPNRCPQTQESLCSHECALLPGCCVLSLAVSGAPCAPTTDCWRFLIFSPPCTSPLPPFFVFVFTLFVCVWVQVLGHGCLRAQAHQSCRAACHAGPIRLHRQYPCSGERRADAVP